MGARYNKDLLLVSPPLSPLSSPPSRFSICAPSSPSLLLLLLFRKGLSLWSQPPSHPHLPLECGEGSKVFFSPLFLAWNPSVVGKVSERLFGFFWGGGFDMGGPPSQGIHGRVPIVVAYLPRKSYTLKL